MSAHRAEDGLGRRLAIAASIVVLVAVAAAVWVTGSPTAQRQARLDERRVSDLDEQEDAVENWFQEHGALPASLAALARQPGMRLAIVDPETGSPYDYAATGARSYRLCARFSTDTALRARTGDLARDVHWAHGVGRQCFERTIPPATAATAGLK
jgi:hypothetical protein